MKGLILKDLYAMGGLYRNTLLPWPSYVYVWDCP